MSCFVGFSMICFSSSSIGYGIFQSKKNLAGEYVVENFA